MIIYRAEQVISAGLARLISLYQQTLSPDHGLLRPLFPYGACRFEPTCSEYVKQAILAHGYRGLLMGLRRLVRCHPACAGGSDPVLDR